MFLGNPEFSVTNKIKRIPFEVSATYSNSSCNEVKEVGGAPSAPAKFPNTKDCGPEVSVTATEIVPFGPPFISCQLNSTIPMILNNLYIRPDYKGPFFGCIITKYNFDRYD